MTTVLLLLLLAQAEGPDAPAQATPAPTSIVRWHSVVREEASTLALLPRGGSGRRESFLRVEPTLVVEGREKIGLNVGAPVRLLLRGGEPSAGPVRREDWDSLSDWGQLVRGLKGGLYLPGTSGTWLYPEVDGTLRPRAFASLGLGVDNAR